MIIVNKLINFILDYNQTKIEMPKVNLWNTISLVRTGKVKLLDSGRELFGTVVKHGVNDKTITVRVSSRHYNHKYKKALYSNKSKQVHDQFNYCVTGDKVIIANCAQISSTKSYFVKTIVKPFPRTMATKDGQSAPQLTPNPTQDPQNLANTEKQPVQTPKATEKKPKQLKGQTKEEKIASKSKGKDKKNNKTDEKNQKEGKSDKKLRVSPDKTKTKKSDIVV